MRTLISENSEKMYKTTMMEKKSSEKGKFCSSTIFSLQNMSGKIPRHKTRFFAQHPF